ncbi:type ISP restriction/modification enzyme [Candidatus Spongiihabitans sp.]|uniref:type ISP restriction/modification enzyme n=1 Tax=Candidatus Spongiihabitans sp. TaxID=3101308 RepID=UPI003C7BC603
MTAQTYLKQLDQHYKAGNATEHTYRAALQSLLETTLPDIAVTNEPKQIECGAPDYVLTRNAIPLGYIEAKDLDKDLNDKAHAAQLRRYTESLGNLIFTNYLEFRLIRDGEAVATVRIAELRGGRVKSKPDQFDAFTDLLANFAGYDGTTIASANDLAHHMAAKARLLARVIEQALHKDAGGANENTEGSDLQNQLAVFKKHLIHDIDRDAFADIYAQTVAYGMFAARLHDPTPATFTRREAAELIPAANPFLRRFFQHIAGYDLDQRIRWAVDDLADLFRAADVGELMKDYGKATQRNDPFLHFYETFLGEYNPKLRKSRGVYYTPEPVVNFIVRAVDEILQTEFGIKDGLADTGKTVIEVDALPSADKRKKGKKGYKREVHKVQILDPATGTGTFLAAIVQQIYETKFANQKGVWAGYVREHLIPRLNGFEVLMASYAMAHTKLEMVLRDSGCELGDDRLRIFLTNSLEEYHSDTGTLFAQWLSAEANEANFIKRDTPVMVVIGNPPYSGISSNVGKWINDLIDVYKYVDGEHFGERKHWLNDDYVKFIRYGQHYIDRTGEGILAYINNHSFLDNPTFRGMRWSLLQSFDKIYLIDLHGNSKKKETAPDGSPDKNVFDIQQGVSINIFIKTANKKDGSLAKVFHRDLYGERESKYQFLWSNDLKQTNFQELHPIKPYYFFIPKNWENKEEYDKGFSMKELFPVSVTGIVTARDKFVIDFDKKLLLKRIIDFSDVSKSDDEMRIKHFGTSSGRKYLPGDSRGWKMATARRKISDYQHSELITEITYRPFDNRNIYYHPDMVDWGREKIMRHFLVGENVGLITSRITKDRFSVLYTKCITAHKSATLYDISYVFPLYLYPDTKQSDLGGNQQRKPNLDHAIVKTIADKLDLRFTPEKEDDNKTFAPIDLLDYIYAVLHSPTYREHYKEFLKIDFPRVPYPTEQKQFRQLATLGGELRALHLMQSPTLDKLITGYNQPGDHKVDKPEYKITDHKKHLGQVHINKTQYFSEVPETAWNFYIGGYQPAQKWLKDRKGRNLNSDDIRHYQKIILALTETDRLMEEINTVWQPQ